MAEKVKSYGAGVLFILFIGVLVWFAGSLRGEQDYDVRPEISVPEYKTDAARAIDAYEKMMNRYMDLTESQFKNVALDNQKTFEKLLEIKTDIARIDMRLERIEQKMGLEPLPAAGTKVQPLQQISPPPPAEQQIPKAPAKEEKM
jgi:hypothetical protein